MDSPAIHKDKQNIGKGKKIHMKSRRDEKKGEEQGEKRNGERRRKKEKQERGGGKEDREGERDRFSRVQTKKGL